MTTKIRKSLDERDKGFTLIELLVVIIIIGILAAIAIPVFLNQRKKGVDASLKTDVKNAATALETYATDNPAATSFATTTPAQTPAQNAATAGFKKSTGNTVEVVGSPANGYCVRALNAGGTGGATGYVWYDSNNGGLQPGAPSATAPTGATTCTGTFVTL